MAIKDPIAAIGRAVKKAQGLSKADLATVVSRLRGGKPDMKLRDMAYVEEIAEGLEVGSGDFDYLFGRLEAELAKK